MHIGEQLATNLLNLYNGTNWTDAYLKQTLESLEYDQAQTVTPVSKNTAAALAHHIGYWNNIIIERISGGNPEIPELNGFDVPVLRSDADWRIEIKKVEKSFQALAETIRSTPEARFSESTQSGNSTIGKNIFGIIEHGYCHAGQLVMIAKFVGQAKLL